MLIPKGVIVQTGNQTDLVGEVVFCPDADKDIGTAIIVMHINASTCGREFHTLFMNAQLDGQACFSGNIKMELAGNADGFC